MHEDAGQATAGDGQLAQRPAHGADGPADPAGGDEHGHVPAQVARRADPAAEARGQPLEPLPRQVHDLDDGDLREERAEAGAEVLVRRAACVEEHLGVSHAGIVTSAGPLRTGTDGMRAGGSAARATGGHERSRSTVAAGGVPILARVVDLRTDNPIGGVPDPGTMSVRTLELSRDGWRLGRRHRAWGGGPTEGLPSLAGTHELRVTGDPGDAADEAGEVLHRAVARGTFVSGDLADGVAAALPEGLAAHITAPAGGRAGDLEWDARAVAQRRAALRPLLHRLPGVSLVLVSRRADLVVPMVERLGRLEYPGLEIVVGLHGVPEPEGLAAAAGERTLVVREFPADQVFGSVVDDAFALASGELVSKVDDDDWFGDHHVLDLVLAHAYSGATLVGKSTTVVYLEAIDTTVRRLYGGVRESFTHRVAGSTFLMSREDLGAVGGWPHVPRAVDTHLITAIRAASGTIYQPHDIGYLYVRNADTSGHTWATGADHFLRNTREQWIGLLRHPEFGTEGEP